MELWELSAREAIRHTIASYTYAADRGRFDDLVALFAPDGVLEVHGIGGARAEGRDAITQFFRGVNTDVVVTAPPGRMQHHVSSVWIDVHLESAARASSYFMVVTGAGVDHWGRYRDDLVPVGDRWLFAHRLVRTDGVTPGGWADSRRRL
jgi:SnoaL-like domain